MDSLIGYRLLRTLGSGPRAEVLLGVADGDSVALKVPRPGVDDATVLVEAEALDRGAGPHVVRLVDLATGPHGTQVLVLERLPGPSLAQLLARRGSITAGEAITVLAPLHAALVRLHGLGVAHGAVRVDAVWFSASGAPVLACFGSARLAEPNRPELELEGDPVVRADRTAFGLLAARVLSAVAPAVPVVGDVATAFAEHDGSAGWGALGARLFELGDAEPVRLDGGPAEPDPQPVPVFRPAPAGEPPSDRASAMVPESRRARRAAERGRSARPVSADPADGRWGVGRVIAQGPGAAARAAVRPARERVSAAVASLRGVRTRVWVTAAAAAVGLLAAAVLVPSGGSSVATPPGPPASPVTTAPGPKGPHPTETGDPAPDAAAFALAVRGDDPIAAFVALWAIREGCLRDRSVLCLDAVGQLGSTALTTDQGLVRALQQGGELPVIPLVTPDRVVIDEELGDSALLSLVDPAETEPASVLLLKGEAGWRIRDYVTP